MTKISQALMTVAERQICLVIQVFPRGFRNSIRSYTHV
jgi:hypothetical protein